LLIYSPDIHCYLNYTYNIYEGQDLAIDIDQELDDSRIISKHGLNEIRGINKSSKRYECNLSKYTETTFKIFLFETDNDEY
jgi:hypothetical protein